MAYKAVFFDVGNTLVSYYKKQDFAPVLENCVLSAIEFLKSQGLMFEPAVILESAWQYNTERDDLKITPLEERLAALFALRGANHPLMPDLVKAFMAPNLALAKPAPGAAQTLATIKNQGLVTGIISNTPWGSSRDMWSAQLAELDLARHIDVEVFCMDVGVRKPHPDIFSHTLALAGVSAQDSLFIGDDPVWDVSGGQGAGMHVVLFDPEGDAINQDTAQLQKTVTGIAPVTIIRSLSEVLDLLGQEQAV